MGRGRTVPDAPFEQLLAQAKMTNALLAAQLLLHMKQQDVIGLLKATGATNQQIADVTGASYATVAVSIGRLHKKAAQKDVTSAEAETTEADLRET